MQANISINGDRGMSSATGESGEVPCVYGSLPSTSENCPHRVANCTRPSSARKKRHRCVSVPSADEFGEMSRENSETERLLSSSTNNGGDIGRRYLSHRVVELQQSNSGTESLTDSFSSNASHCHDVSERSQIDKKARTKLIVASLLCLLFMVGEMVGGVVAHSLAIISDAAHLLTDFASFMISLLALYLANRRATKKLSFGWYRVEILGALISILMLWVLTGILVYSAALRIIDESYEIDSEVMLITASCGVAFNIALGVTLHQSGHVHSHLGGGGGGGHSHGKKTSDDKNNANHQHGDSSSSATTEVRTRYGSMDEEEGSDYVRFKNPDEPRQHRGSNINVKAAFVHVVGDLCQSVGVLIAALIIYFKPEWKMADPICTFLFSIFVIVTTVTILRDILVVLMEGTPRHLVFSDVRDAFYQVDGVKDIHNLRVWSLTMDKTALSVHIAVYKGTDTLKVLKTASEMIQSKFDIKETTMQIEEYVEEMLDCTYCQDLKD